VLNHAISGNTKQGDESSPTDTYEKEERAAIQQENASAGGKTPTSPSQGASQMLLKRSVSPDGRIDSLSVEFSCSVEDATDKEIDARAERFLYLQSGIMQGFMEQNGKAEKKQKPASENHDGSIPAQMLTVGGMPGKWGRRLFINVDANGQTLKLFGNKKQLAEDIVAAGFPDLSEHIVEGTKLNLPCRVVTKPSDDGKYVNIERVLPIEALRFTRKPAP
jgi:hypothetical protein